MLGSVFFLCVRKKRRELLHGFIKVARRAFGAFGGASFPEFLVGGIIDEVEGQHLATHFQILLVLAPISSDILCPPFREYRSICCIKARISLLLNLEAVLP